MKKIIKLLTIILLSISVHAECYWSDFHLKITIETTDGKINNGHMRVSSCRFDFLNMDETLFWSDEYDIHKKALNQNGKWWEKIMKDTLNYFQDKGTYERYSIAYYLNKKNIPFEGIKTITVEELSREPNYIWISSGLQPSDSTWKKKEPIKEVEFIYSGVFYTNI